MLISEEQLPFQNLGVQSRCLLLHLGGSRRRRLPPTWDICTEFWSLPLADPHLALAGIWRGNHWMKDPPLTLSSKGETHIDRKKRKSTMHTPAVFFTLQKAKLESHSGPQMSRVRSHCKGAVSLSKGTCHSQAARNTLVGQSDLSLGARIAAHCQVLHGFPTFPLLVCITSNHKNNCERLS